MAMRSNMMEARGQDEEGARAHDHRTAKVVELVGSSTEGFEEAIECVLEDARATTRGITGAHVENFSVKCHNGRVTEYKVNLKVAFGIERTGPPNGTRSRNGSRAPGGRRRRLP